MSLCKFHRRPLASTICSFSKGKWNILVLDHMLDLPFHRHKEENQPIYYQNWPEDGHIEYREKGGKRPHENGSKTGIPKLKFWQSPHKRSKLIIRF